MPRGHTHQNHRGRGDNHNGRGPSRGRGWGRGGPHRGIIHTAESQQPTATTSNHAPHRPYPNPNAEIDVVIQQWHDEPISHGPPVYPGGANRGGNVNRGNGPWRPKSRSGAGTPSSGTNSPRRGASTPRGRGRGNGPWNGRGRGRGRGWGQDDKGLSFHPPHRSRLGLGGKARFGIDISLLGKDATLSDLLYTERPLLRPVKFVRATLTPFLFQDSEDVLKPAIDVVDATEASHVPTADRVAQLFRENRTGSDSDSDSEDTLEEIDFADMAQVRAAVDAIAQKMDTDKDTGKDEDAIEEVDFADLAAIRAEVDTIAQKGIASTSMDADKDTRKEKDVIEEVDFADLAAIRAEFDAAVPQPTSREDTIEEVFTGVYNHINEILHGSSTADMVHGDELADVQQPVPSLASPIVEDSLDPTTPSVDMSSPSHLDSDAIVAEDEAPLDPAQQTAPLSAPPIIDNLHPSTDTSTSPRPESILVEDDVPVDQVSTQATSPSTAPEPHPIPDTSSPDDPHPRFIIDTEPTRPFIGRSTSDLILVDRAGHGETLGDHDEEERIVYVAPHPRSRRAASPRPAASRAAISTGEVEMGRLSSPVREDHLSPRSNVPVVREAKAPFISLASLTIAPTPRTKASARARKKEAQIQRRRQRKDKLGGMGFGAYGAMMSEAALREEDVVERQRSRWERRRRGDSDVDWGTEDENEEGAREDHGMEVDPDLALDMGAMQGFVQSMSAKGSQFVSIDDIEDEARIGLEDEDSQGGPDESSDSEHSEQDTEIDEEEEAMFNMEEADLVAESEGEEELSEDSDDDDDEPGPGSGFQARLRRMRERSRVQRSKDGIVQEIFDSEEEEEDERGIVSGTRGASDEAFIARISDLIEENSHMLSGRDRKQRNALFRHVHEGRVDDPEFTTPVNKKQQVRKADAKGKDKEKRKQPPTEYDEDDGDDALKRHLEAQWAKDRAKKAAQRQAREEAKMRTALDPLSNLTNPNKGSKVSRKAMRKAAMLDPEKARAIAPWAVLDLASLEKQIRRFAEGEGEGDNNNDNDNNDNNSSGKGKAKDTTQTNGTNENKHADAKTNTNTNTNTNTHPRPRTLAFPPMPNELRKRVHELAVAFGVKSVSKGSGTARYTTLIRTTRTGVNTNESKIRALMKRYGGGGKGGGGEQMPKHREGDEVGKAAPKIGESNIGFKMLASMGWQEGDQIGGATSVGIQAPLTAIIKHSKLGLGATRE